MALVQRLTIFGRSGSPKTYVNGHPIIGIPEHGTAGGCKSRRAVPLYNGDSGPLPRLPVHLFVQAIHSTRKDSCGYEEEEDNSITC